MLTYSSLNANGMFCMLQFNTHGFADRDKDKMIDICLDNMQICYTEFDEEDQENEGLCVNPQPEKEPQTTEQLVFKIHSIEIVDHLKASKINKMLHGCTDRKR